MTCGARHTVRIVARIAGETPVAFEEAPGFPEPVDGADGFELVIVTRSGRMVEGEHEPIERFTGLE